MIVKSNNIRKKSTWPQDLFRTKGCMDEYKDKFEKDKPIKKYLKNLKGQN